MITELLELPKYGTVGIMISLVMVNVYLIAVIYKIVGNHLNHNTESNIKLAESLTKLSGSVDNNTNATKELRSEVTEFRIQKK